MYNFKYQNTSTWLCKPLNIQKICLVFLKILSTHLFIWNTITHLMTITLYTSYEEWISLVKCIHEAMERLLKLSSNSERLLSCLPKLLITTTITLGSSCQCLHSLQVLQTLFASFPWSKGLVFPVQKNQY